MSRRNVTVLDSLFIAAALAFLAASIIEPVEQARIIAVICLLALLTVYFCSMLFRAVRG